MIIHSIYRRWAALLMCILLFSILITTNSYAGNEDDLTKCQIAYQRCIIATGILLPNIIFETQCAAGYVWCVIFLE